MKQKLRRIVIDGEVYLYGWRHRHNCLVDFPHANGSPGCAEVFVAYHQLSKRSRLEIQFPWHSTQTNGDLTIREIFIIGDGTHEWVFNPNVPSSAAALIMTSLSHGWQPKDQLNPKIIIEGIAWMNDIGLTIGEDRLKSAI
jgi:hypothetical protein